VARYPEKYNRKPCLVKVGHMTPNLKDNQVVGCITTETLQGTWGVHTEKMSLPVLTPNEQESLVQAIEFSSKNAVTSVES
jgi:hypothetical protein